MKDKSRRRLIGISLAVLLLGTTLIGLVLYQDNPRTGRFHISEATEPDVIWAQQYSKDVKGILFSHYEQFEENDYVFIKADKSAWAPKGGVFFWGDSNTTLIVPMDVEDTSLTFELKHQSEDVNYSIILLRAIDGAQVTVELKGEEKAIYHTFKIEKVEMTSKSVDMTQNWDPLMQYPPQRSVVLIG
jgi:hypothetical protein